MKEGGSGKEMEDEADAVPVTKGKQKAVGRLTPS